jgi:hypothetical protein
LQIVLPKRLASALLAFPLVAVAADPLSTVTLLEGEATIVRGATRYALAEGVRIRPGDIIEVADKGLAQVEFADGAALAMGARTRLLTVSALSGKPAHAECYVMQGALKLTGAKQDARFRFSAPVFTVRPAEGDVVLVVGASEGSVFVESGETRVTVGSSTVLLRGGDFYTRKDGRAGAVAPRPSKAFIASLPKLFFDPLPHRMARYENRLVEPRRVGEVSYATVEAWLKAPPAVRLPLVTRFEPRASDPAFRAALVKNLKYHPEWDPILNPPPKEQPTEPQAGNASLAREPASVPAKEPEMGNSGVARSTVPVKPVSMP